LKSSPRKRKKEEEEEEEGEEEESTNKHQGGKRDNPHTARTEISAKFKYLSLSVCV